MSGSEFDDLLKKYESAAPDEVVDQEKVRPAVLVIDDDASLRRGLSRNLGQKFNVAVAESGQQGIQMLNSQYHCVVLDVKMQDLSGFETYPRLKEKCPEIPIVFYTAFQSDHDLQDIINRFKPEGYVEKGRSIAFLEHLIDQAVDKYRLILENESYRKGLEEKVQERTRELELAQAQLLTADKLASIGQLSAGIAHEINNPAVSFNRGVVQLKDILSEIIENHRQWIDQLDRIPQLRQICRNVYTASQSGTKISTRELRVKTKEISQLLEESGIVGQASLAKDIARMDLSDTDLSSLTGLKDLAEPVELLKQIYGVSALMDTMDVSAGRIIRITESLKRYSHMDQAPEGKVDLVASIEDTLTILHHHLKYGIEIQRHFNPVSPIQCFPAELGQVWTNLIMNAVHAMGGKGRLDIRVDQEGDHVIVEVQDTGTGIPEDIQGKIFDPFFSTKPQAEGTGLGLSIVHKIITERHNGRITLSSAPGKTIFTVTLPLTIKEQ